MLLFSCTPGFTRVGVRWLVLLVVFAPFRVFCLPLVRYLLRIVSWGWVHPCWAAGLLLLVAVYRVRGHPKFLHGISSLFLPPFPSMSGSLPIQWHCLCVVAQVLIYPLQLFSYCLYKSLKPLGIRFNPSLATGSRTN